MNILDRPELMDRLAASYALGTLRGGARRRFETLARSSPTLRVMAQVWQERFMSITELQPSEAPDPNVWKRIENIVAAEAKPRLAAAESAGADLLRRARDWWRAGAIVAALATVAAVAVTLNLRGELAGRETELARLQAQGVQLARSNTELRAQLEAQPHVAFVSVLTDDQANPMMLAMFDHKHGQLMLKRMVSFQEGPEKSLQLWAIAASGAPRSMGVLGEQAVVQMPAAAQVLVQSPTFAISLEPKGGVSGDRGPTGPVLWKGAVLRTPL